MIDFCDAAFDLVSLQSNAEEQELRLYIAASKLPPAMRGRVKKIVTLEQHNAEDSATVKLADSLIQMFPATRQSSDSKEQ